MNDWNECMRERFCGSSGGSPVHHHVGAESAHGHCHRRCGEYQGMGRLITRLSQALGLGSGPAQLILPGL